MKYSINSSGYIVAERDIYSLGGFIPKGSVGAKVANEDQISQDGECWVAGGNMSARPDVRIKDNAYVGNWFASSTALHDDVVTELSGNTLIPGTFVSRSPAADIGNNFFAKDSFIGVSMDVLCGPAATATAFPFEQGGYLSTAPRGTAFSSSAIQSPEVNICRGTAVIVCGNNTRVYLPTGYSGKVLWAYTQNGTAVYSGESVILPSGLSSISHPVYKQFMLHVNKINSTAMTPADLLATGAKILGHISGVTVDIRPESASGQYVIDNSSFIMNTDNFGLNTIQLRYLAGSMYDTNMYTQGISTNYKIYGTFHNVQRLEYTKELPDSHRTAATRDIYISAYDCPLLRVDNTTYNDSLAAKGNLTLRRCIVPKAVFQNDVVNGNTYEDIDFSYANEDLGYTMTGYTRFISSHKQGIYRLGGDSSSLGFTSHKGNLADTARLYQAENYIPLDGSIIEQGAYAAGSNLGANYETTKVNSNSLVRTYKPVLTEGLILPSMPTGFVLDAIVYLDETFIIRKALVKPGVIETTYKFAVMQFRRSDTTALTASEFIALNRTLRTIDQAKAPEITGSAYVGADCTVRGDVKLIGDPYVNRVLDVNMWEHGISDPLPGSSWQSGFSSPGAHNRMRSKNLIQVEPGATIKRTDNNLLLAWFFDSFGKRTGSSSTGWVTSFVVPEGVSYVGLMIAKDGLLTEEDIPLANVKYVRAFKKRRYIVNELDRTSPEDILLSVDYQEQGYVDRVVGSTYEALKSASVNYIRLRLPVNTGRGATATQAEGYSRITVSLDSLTKCVSPDSAIVDGTPLCGVVFRKTLLTAMSPAEVPSSRFKIEFTPSPRIVVPYGSATLFISGPKIRMYDNSVLSRNLNQQGEIVLQGDAVMGYDFNSGDCMCSNGHSDAIIKLP